MLILELDKVSPSHSLDNLVVQGSPHTSGLLSGTASLGRRWVRPGRNHLPSFEECTGNFLGINATSVHRQTSTE